MSKIVLWSTRFNEWVLNLCGVPDRSGRVPDIE